MLHKRFLMHKLSRISSAMVLFGMTAAISPAQSVTSAHSGTLHYFDGDVSLDGVPVQSKIGKFSEIKEQGVLSTARGRAEVLLTPGVFLRIGENSSIKLLDNRLLSTRVEVLSGTVIVESDDPLTSIKNSPVSLIYKDYEIQMVKHGLIEIESDPAQMKVYKGEALVIVAKDATNDRTTVREGRLLPFSAALLTEKFNDKVGDDLYLWTRDRSQSISTANMSSARSLNSSGNGYASSGYGLGSGNWNGGWYFNPYFSMYTYVPAGGTFWNAWGYGFFSPSTIYSYYTPSTYWYGGGGSRGTGSIGRPISGVATNPTSGRAAPLSALRGGNSSTSGSLPVLGSPLRGGSAIGASPNSSVSGGNSASAGRASISAGSGGGGGARMSSGGGAAASGTRGR
jgi:hypothetical protein